MKTNSNKPIVNKIQMVSIEISLQGSAPVDSVIDIKQQSNEYNANK